MTCHYDLGLSKCLTPDAAIPGKQALLSSITEIENTNVRPTASPHSSAVSGCTAYPVDDHLRQLS